MSSDNETSTNTASLPPKPPLPSQTGQVMKMDISDSPSNPKPSSMPLTQDRKLGKLCFVYILQKQSLKFFFLYTSTLIFCFIMACSFLVPGNPLSCFELFRCNTLYVFIVEFI